MGTRGRKLTKTVHSEGQAAFRELMTRARKAAGLTQQELLRNLESLSPSLPNTRLASDVST